MTVKISNPFDLDDDAAYQHWREQKLQAAPAVAEEILVEIGDPQNLTAAEHEAMVVQCRKSNMVVYTSMIGEQEGTQIARDMGAQFGCTDIDHNRGAEEDSVTALTVREDALHKRYIPYSDRAIHWHTDGYYNRLEEQDYSVLLHCVRPASAGGENELIDHELAYLFMRDENPDFIRALMQPDAMLVPKNVSEGGEELRPDRAGPVFLVTESGNLHMRYTMRKRNIVWKGDPLVREAVAWLEDFLNGKSQHGSRYILKMTLQSGWGLLCNNVLHNRSGFADDTNQRLIYRLRSHDRIRGT